MERVAQFLKEAETYYLATVEGDQPRVRPFGTAHIFEGKLYIQTGKVKDVSKQIHACHDLQPGNRPTDNAAKHICRRRSNRNICQYHS